MNNKYLCVFDFETISADPTTTQPTQLAAVILHPRRLNIVDEFNSEMRILPEYHDLIEDKALQITRKKREDITSEETPHPKQVWTDFVHFCEKYNTDSKQSQWGAPIACGHNILGFDIPIYKRLSEQYKTLDRNSRPYLFNKLFAIDTMHLLFSWFEGSTEVEKFNMDYLRNYFGIADENAHDALQDVKDTAAILVRFLNLHRTLSGKVPFKNAFVKKKVN